MSSRVVVSYNTPPSLYHMIGGSERTTGGRGGNWWVDGRKGRKGGRVEGEGREYDHPASPGKEGGR